jgi:hypothetical protein
VLSASRGAGEEFLRRDPVKFEYVEVDASLIPQEWGPGANSILIVPCVRCGRLTEDRTVDSYGDPMPDHMLDESDRNPLCEHCQREDFDHALEEDLLDFLESRLGLAEKHRDALKAIIETIFTDPDKILKLERLSDRVVGLERELGIWKWVAGISAGVALSALGLAVKALLGP